MEFGNWHARRWVLLGSMIGILSVGCVTKTQSNEPLSLARIEQQLDVSKDDGPVESLCDTPRAPLLSDLVASSIERAKLEHSTMPNSYLELASLSRITSSLLESKHSAHTLATVKALVALRYGYPLEKIQVKPTPDGFEAWYLPTSTTSFRLAKLPACEAYDFSHLAPALRTRSDLLPAFEITEDIHYLGLGDIGSRPTWDDLLDDQHKAKKLKPPPTPRLEFSQWVTAERTSGQEFDLSLLTYNTGLLDYEIFGSFTVAEVPYLEERLTPLLERIFIEDDIIAFQEIWRPTDAEKFFETAKERGYSYFDTPKHHASNGLGIAVKRELIDHRKPLTHEVITFTDILLREYLGATWTTFGAVRGVKRGFQALSFSLVTGQSITVINSHFTAYHKNWTYRIKQARQLASYARNVNSDIVVVLGDFNGDLHYQSGVGYYDTDYSESDWYANAFSTPLLKTAGKLDDWSSFGFNHTDLDQCYRLPLIKRDTSCVATWDIQTNKLVTDQYATPNGPSERLDHIFGRIKGQSLISIESELALRDEVSLGNGLSRPLSDHYGVRVVVKQAQTKPKGADHSQRDP